MPEPAERMSLLDARILRYALASRRRWQIRAWWAVRGGTAERELALRWLPSRYRLMVATPDGDWTEWVRNIGAKRIPIFTRREGERRKAEFLRTHPGDRAKVERHQGNA